MLSVFQVIELLGDGMYNAPLVQTGRYHLDMGKDTYFYVFSHSNYTTNQAMGSPQYKVKVCLSLSLSVRLSLNLCVCVMGLCVYVTLLVRLLYQK